MGSAMNCCWIILLLLLCCNCNLGCGNSGNCGCNNGGNGSNGCGGNRDRGKRPIMAREAVLRSDKVILTSDNPRDEDPDEILREMQEGVPAEKQSITLTITDRRQAIKVACQLAQSGDVVMVAGKGHEDYQEIKGVKHHFDDREEIIKIFETEK